MGSAKKEAIVAVRELFLRCLRRQYEEQGKQGLLPAGSPGHFALNSSLDHALEEVDQGLTDVSHVFHQINKQGWYGKLFSLSIDEWGRACLLSSLISAHAEVRETLEETLGRMKVFEEAKEAVMEESTTQVRLAQTALDEMDSKLVKALAPRTIACKVMAGSEEHIEEHIKSGMLGEADAHHLLEEIEKDIIAAQSQPRYT